MRVLEFKDRVRRGWVEARVLQTLAKPESPWLAVLCRCLWTT